MKNGLKHLVAVAPSIVKLLTEHHLEFLSLKGGCTGSSKSTHFKMPHCWKSHALDQLYIRNVPLNIFKLNGISHYYRLNQSISVLLVVRWYFIIFIQILIEYSVFKQCRPRSDAVVCTACICPTKRMVAVYE